MRLKPPSRKTTRTFARKVAKTGTYEWRSFWRNQPIQTDSVLYESFAGNGMLCNPEAIFRRLLDKPEFAHLTHTWVLAGSDLYRATMSEFAGHPRVRFVRYKSPQYHRALATSKYLVNNATFPPEFSKREGQVYVNTWHGTPLKHMGYDEPGGGPATKNVVRNFLAANYLLASSAFMAEQMYESAYRMTNIYPGKVVIEGSPRVDRQELDEAGVSRVRGRLRGSGVALRDHDKVVLYAPTWRGASFHSPTNDVTILGNQVRALQAELPEDCRVLLKVHQQAYKFALEHPDLREILVPNDIPSNEVLGISDILVNDYSSIFFDFLATGRPIIFFTPDLASYEGERGLYLAEEELPGPVVSRIDELSRLIRSVGTDEPQDPLRSHRAEYDAARRRFAPKEDGHSTDRIIDIVFNVNGVGYDVRSAKSDGRRKILLYLGGMRSNGITTSALNLLDNIDHDLFDVSAFYVYSTHPDRVKNQAAIHPRVRVLPRIGGLTPSKRHRRDRLRLLTLGVEAPKLNLSKVQPTFRDEWRRCFGDAEFDYIVDFSGYAPFWSFLLMQGSAAPRSIWLHNDLKADQAREVNGHRPHEANLRAVFSTYSGYDHLVSVSSPLKEINAEKLQDAAPPQKHTSARNTINYERTLDMAHGVGSQGTTEGEHQELALPLSNLSGAVAELATHHDLASISAEVHRRRAVDRVIPDLPGVTTFVTVGRLSPEKNHARLIRSFDLLHQEHPDTRLVIIGNGPLRSELHVLVTSLGLAKAVVLAGHQDNPYAIMAKANCFILSSDYEGQPMVILEARVLGLPVVTTDFASVKGALPEGVGLVVDRTVESLAWGMTQALKGEVPNPPFDPVAYNRTAVGEFYRAIGAQDDASTLKSSSGARQAAHTEVMH